jgi:LmbE family N-acetylglucosaminyl deacetylase
MVTTEIAGAGTSEDVWRPWLAGQVWPELDLAALVAGRRVVVLAAHPDDEVLGVGGLLRRLASCGSSIVIVWATDGEASHPGSTALAPARLASLRRAESVAAVGELGVRPETSHHLGLPDSGLAECGEQLVDELGRIVDSADVVLAPWRGDGHPDHEAVGEAAAKLTTALIEYPIWMWHWAAPSDDRVPWHRARSVGAVDVGAKAAAIDAFDTQVRPLGPAIADAPVLPAHVIARFQRADELVFQ